ncbi:ABC transporter permease [Neorhizobium galegae]|uniref:Hydroxymethylpyrimidine transport system permease protein n=1 Tax=Neorhizobium galegae bv. orientalis str. HAMBI 540 TaxID=1028800 RepID=A0A068SYY0_NEOGA|nr:ABC transporter permease [Neorhizobium galegae]MCQ1854910.1 ABC transporter permease [Neorhizobium galegae]CDN51407.1 Hydroxymethylpyrimidine transport system permease protein [Neorhizobium galegae bv. orientalis str. HAMBI 540]
MSPVTASSNARRISRGFAGAFLLAAIWELSVRGFNLPAYVLPSVSSIIAGMFADAGKLVAAARFTAAEALAGYLLGCIIGIAAAIAVSMVPRSRSTVMSVATAVNSVPVVAYSPLVLLWFGIGMTSKIVMVAVAVSFTIFLSTIAGLDRVDRKSVDLVRSFGAGRMAVLWRLRLPTALPLIIAGMRVSTVRSVIVAIVTEMLGAYGGLGWVIYQAVLQIDFVQVWAAIIVASAISLCFFGVISFIEQRYIFWR